MFERSRALLERLEPHIFHGGGVRTADLRAALLSLWRQGMRHARRRDYFRLLWTGMRRDAARLRDAQRALVDLERRTHSASDLAGLVDCAHEAMVRGAPTRRLDEVAEWARTVRVRLAEGAATPEQSHAIHRWSREYFDRQRRPHPFARSD